MTELAMEPLERSAAPTTTDLAFRTLFDAIVTLRLPPGSKISEAEVAGRLGVSRQPVRDAFFRLSRLGFIEIRPQRATLITRISPRDVFDAVFIRTAVEVECLRTTAAGMTPARVARLRGIIAGQAAVQDDPDPTRFHRQDDLFHAALCDMAGQAGAWELIQEQKAHMDRVRFLTLSAERRQMVMAEHESIVAALEAGDSAGAEAGMRRHIGDIHNVLPRLQAAHADYFEPGR